MKTTAFKPKNPFQLTDIIGVVDPTDKSMAPTGTNVKGTLEQVIELAADIVGESQVTSVNGETGDVVINQDEVPDGIINKGYTAAEKAKLAAMSGAELSPFVTAADGYFYLKGERFRYDSFNYNPLNSLNKQQATSLFDALQEKRATVLRTWLFPNFYQQLVYPLAATNLIPNYDFETDFSGWIPNGEFTRSTELAQTGTYGIKQVSAGGFNNIHTDPITVTPGTNYTLTLWYYRSAQGGFGPLLKVMNGDLSVQILDGGLMEQSGGWIRKQVNFNSGVHTSVSVVVNNFGGTVTFYYDNFHLGLTQTPVLEPVESVLANWDMLLDEARKKGIKLHLSMADNNDNFNTKGIVIGWANIMYNAGLSTGFPKIGFFNSTLCRNIEKASFDVLANRVNTINGLVWKDDPTIFAWEGGNELRIDRFDSESGTQNTPSSTNIALMADWINDIGGHIKAVDTNHMFNPTSLAHTWRHVPGDTVYNGSGYGVDYRILGALDVVDFLDYHLYPTQDAQNSANWPMGELDITSYGVYLLGLLPPIRQTSGSVTSFNVTLNAAAQVGDILVVHAAFNSSVAAPTVTDNVGNTYTLTSSAGGNTQHNYSSTHSIPGATQITLSWSGNRTVTVLIDENSGRVNANNVRTKAGLDAQIVDFVAAAKELGKPAVLTETGFSMDVTRNNYHYPLQPRGNGLAAIAATFFGAGGDGINYWHAVNTAISGGSYDIALRAFGGEAVTDNSNDTNTMNLIKKYNDRFQLDIVASQGEVDVRYARSRFDVLAADGTWQGTEELGTAGAALAFGQLCYLNDDDSRWELTDSDIPDSFDKKLGICILAASGDGKPTKMLLQGKVRADAQFPTMTVGAPVYMSDTAGAVVSTLPTASAAARRVVGWADTADILHFSPAVLTPVPSPSTAITQSMKNTSGGTLNAGDVVILKSVAVGDEVTTTTTAGDNKVFGMVYDTSIANNAYGLIQVLGKTTALKVDGTTDIAIGDFLTTFTTAKIAQKAVAGNTVFARALEAYTANDSLGVLDALLIPPRLI